MSEKWNETHGNQKITQRSDPLFASNFLGTDALSAVNIAGPFLAIALAIGTMIATGGCALVSGRMGEGQMEKARQNFSFFMLFSVAISTLFCVLGILFRRPILYAMGADEALYHLCEAYAVPIFLLIPFAMVSIVLQIFFVAAGRPGLGFGLSIAGGVTNIVLDYVLLAVFPLGVAGAAYASAAGYFLLSVIGVVFFLVNRKGSLYFVRPKFDGRALGKACSNGMSEMVGMLAVTVTMIAMHVILMRLVGSDAVAAAAIILSAQTILSAGYVQGIAPVVSYHFGAENFSELKRFTRAALKTVAGMSLLTFAIAFPLARPIALLFAENSAPVTEMAVRGTYIFAAAFLLMGFNLFASGFFHGTERRKDLRHSFAVSDTDLSHPSPADPSTSLVRGWRVDLHAGGRSSEYSALRFLLPSDEKQISLRIRRLQ